MMIRLLILFQILLITSCVTTRSIDHFASKNKLFIKEGTNISFFDGKLEIEFSAIKKTKDPIYLLYKKDRLNFVSNVNRIDNNDYVYKLNQPYPSIIILTRATMQPRYYNVDTLLFGHNVAFEKNCLYDNNKIVAFYFKEYKFSNDTLKITSYKSFKDLIPLSFFESDSSIISEEIGKPYKVEAFTNESKLSFFKKFIHWKFILSLNQGGSAGWKPSLGDLRVAALGAKKIHVEKRRPNNAGSAIKIVPYISEKT